MKKAINDIDKSNWNKEETRRIAPSLWYFNNDTDPATRVYPKTLKNPPKTFNKRDFHGAFIYQIPIALITRYTKKGDVVFDLFGGSKTTQRAAASAGRNSILIDLVWKPKLKKFHHKKSNTRHYEYGHDSTDSNLPEILINKFEERNEPVKKASLTILHPPYYDIIKFTNPKKIGDLSYLGMPTFEKVMENVGFNAVRMTKPGGFIALVFGDIYKKGTLYPAHNIANIIGRFLTLNLKAIFIKNITGNEATKGVNRGLWEYRALVNGFAYFQHEYVYVWQKQKP